MRLTYTLLVISLHKINMLVSFAAPLNTRPSVRSSERQRIFLQRRWQAARADYDALAGGGVNAQLGGVSSPRPSDSWTQTQPLNITMTSLINHSQSVRYSHSLLSTSYWQCHLHTTLSVSWYLILFFIFIFLWLLHVNHVQPVCTFLSRTVMLILIFNSTAYCHAHSFILYILFFISYFLFILFYAYFPCVVFYNICTVHGADLTLISLLVIQSLYSRVCDK